MRLKSVLLTFALLLGLSTATSYVGYRYLNLASEFRERNFTHLSETYGLITMLDGAPTTLRPAHVSSSREHLEAAGAQAQWCLDVLNDFEKRIFQMMGAGRALEICQRDLVLNQRAMELLDAMDAAFANGGEGPSFAMGLRLRDYARALLEDSLAFQPFVSLIEDKVGGLVRTGTAIAAAGLTLIFTLIGRDLIIAQRVEARQKSELSRLATIAQRANDSIVVTDAAGRITWVNPAFEALSGYTLAEIEGQRPGALLQGAETSQGTRAEIRKALEEQLPIRTDILNYSSSDRPYWINLSIAPLYGSAGELTGFVSISSDITEERQNRLALETANEKIVHQALHDPLTGLPNRRYIDGSIENQVSNSDAPRALIRIDLDHFKNVNDTLGHAAGDFVLCEVAEILRAQIRSGDIAARVGGDEFVILLAPGTTEEEAVALTERLRCDIRKDMSFEGQTCRVGASFGVSSSTMGLIRNDELLKSADAALYIAKAKGRNTTRLYTPSVHQSVLEKRQMSVEIERGLERREFEAYFQPQFDADTEVLIGIETLARWKHPTQGILAPGAFLPVAEQLKLVPDIDRHVLDYGLDCAADLNGEGLFVPKISFNVGLAQIMNPELSQVASSKEIGLTRVSFEVLESVLIEDQSSDVLERINDLRARDFGIELDDFGSGHASVIALQKLSPDIMKLDGQLVAPIHNDKTARSLVASMIEMGKTLGIDVLAEGVETATHAAILRDLGCDALQGYYFSKPMSFTDLRNFARSGFDEKMQKVTSLSVRRDRTT